jgi:hypothetical protein
MRAPESWAARRASTMRVVDDGRPGAVIVALVVGLSHLGYDLRDALDPRNGSDR